MDDGVKPRRCQLDHEVDMSCCYPPQLHGKSGRIYEQVEESKGDCAHIHDHQSARQHAFDGYRVYRWDTRAKSSTGVVQYENLVKGFRVTN
jgi:hypothetical protein